MGKYHGTLENASAMVLRFVLAGMSDDDVAREVAKQTRDSHVCHKSAVYFWRKRHKAEIDEARAEARRRATEAGIADKAERLRLYQKLVDGHMALLEDLKSATGEIDLETAKVMIATAGGGIARLLRLVAEEQGDIYRGRAMLEPVGRGGVDSEGAAAAPVEVNVQVVNLVREYKGFNPEDIG